jgi:formate dehydrogenase subunit beta
MSDLEDRLRETARQLLVEQKVDVIIGYEQGTLPLRTTPCFVREPEQVDRLVWNQHCENNLAEYLHHASGKVGVVAKGCDARSIAVEVVERQVPREDIVVIGVPCQGMIDRHAIELQLDGREVLQAQVSNGSIVLEGEGFEETLDLQGMLCEDCLICAHKNPALYDVLVGEPVQEVTTKPDAVHPSVEELESWSAEERWEYFSSTFSRCIRCYACREACPCCYCTECFVDQTQPSWFAKSDDLSDIMAFHLVRIYHVAGRCLDCGACARACPMDIDIRILGRKLAKEIQELYDYESGLDDDSLPLLGTYRPNDPQGFIR